MENTLNVNLGGIIFLNALIEKGRIKAQIFKASGNKLCYAYVLISNLKITPQ